MSCAGLARRPERQRRPRYKPDVVGEDAGADRRDPRDQAAKRPYDGLAQDSPCKAGCRANLRDNSSDLEWSAGFAGDQRLSHPPAIKPSLALQHRDNAKVGEHRRAHRWRPGVCKIDGYHQTIRGRLPSSMEKEKLKICPPLADAQKTTSATARSALASKAPVISRSRRCMSTMCAK